MKKISHLTFPIKIMFGIIVVIIIVIMSNFIITKQNKITESFKEIDLSSNDIINCTLNISSNVRVEGPIGNKIIAEVSKMKTSSEVTITGILGENPKIKGDRGEEVEVTKLATLDTILFLEKSGGNIHTWTFFPKTGILIVSKAYELITPYGSQIIGTCK